MTLTDQHLFFRTAALFLHCRESMLINPRVWTAGPMLGEIDCLIEMQLIVESLLRKVKR